ncbi:DinB family protein [Salinicoccus sesuvii]|uniref:DinB family protein n=1 Tax=Salinicoccus sesuvii TaxID=868281 RepID=A0ABV7N8X0_9STAP
MKFEQEYLNLIKTRFQEVKRLGDRTLDQLSEADLHWRYNEDSNTVAILVKHLRGNMYSRWSDVFTTDGEKPDRHRDGEFEDDLKTMDDVLLAWEEGWQLFLNTLAEFSPEDLLRTQKIRGEDHTILEAIERQHTHYASHVGQMMFIGKQLKLADWQSLSIPKGQSEQYLKREK